MYPLRLNKARWKLKKDVPFRANSTVPEAYLAQCSRAGPLTPVFTDIREINIHVYAKW